MKIGFVCPSSREPVGGTIVLYEFANALAARGHEVHIGHAALWRSSVTSLAEIPWFSFDETIHHHFTASDHDGPVDVVFGAGELVDLPTTLPAGLIQGFDMLGPEIESEWFRQPGLKVCVASWLLDAAAQLGTPADRCVTISPGISLDTFRPRTAIAGRPPAVAMLAHEHPAKGTALGLATLERVHAERPEVPIVLFSGHLIERPIPPWVEHVVNLEHHELSELFNRSSIFLQASAYEGFGLTAIEAMASGCALVTTDNGGSRDYAFHGTTALVTDRGDEDSLVRAIVHLIDDEGERVRLAEAGHRFAQRFSWEESASELEARLEAYLADPAPMLAPPGTNHLEGVRAHGRWAARVLAQTTVDSLTPDAAAGRLATLPARPRAGTPARPAAEEGAVPSEDQVVFNLVWTGRTFDHLLVFTRSLMAHSRARFRFVANACPPDQVRAMDRFATQHPDRVVGVDVVSTERMVRHGDALDEVFRGHHDGELFAFIDPDILARGPYLAPLLDRLTSASAVTSGREVWSEHNTRPAGHLGVNGEYFFDQDGYVFGSPHFALYRRHDLEEVVDRWKVGFSTDGNVDPEVRARLEELGRSFLIYDTGKVVNILLQGDGHRLVHEESDQIVHVGGMSHYLAPPQPVRSPDGSYVKEWGQEDDWRKWDGMADRWDIAEYSARALQAVSIGKPPPEPHTVADHLTARATTVFDAFTELSLLLGLGDQPRDAP